MEIDTDSLTMERTGERKRKSALKRKYNLTLAGYDKLYQKQKGRCDICGKHQSELKKALDVDHNHTTGKVRGLLCTNCNYGLGHFKADDVGTDLLIKAIMYMGRH